MDDPWSIWTCVEEKFGGKTEEENIFSIWGVPVKEWPEKKKNSEENGHKQPN